MAQQLYAAAQGEGLDVQLSIQEGCRHQFPPEPDAFEELFSTEG